MKFFLEFVACCGSGARQQPAEESTLLVVPEARPRVGRKRGRVAGERRCGLVDWQPSLSSIAEDNVLPERNTKQAPRRSLKRKGGASITHRGRAHSTHHDGVRRASVPAVLPTFSPTPFIFL
ncbi:uncharacterized protein Fot_39978 [Forsythia ovata]|uniref:Uncharacterized protein n=1 Tax=Forsythia ovata TaxID=205694 RepID=A0ABD1S648_9LAMI